MTALTFVPMPTEGPCLYRAFQPDGTYAGSIGVTHRIDQRCRYGARIALAPQLGRTRREAERQSACGFAETPEAAMRLLVSAFGHRFGG